MIRETITFTFENEEQQRRFHERLKGEKCRVKDWKMIRETITFAFEDEEQRKRFHERLKAEQWKCAARRQGTAGGNDAAECDWPTCGCDLYATKVVETMIESGWKRDP